MAHPHWPLFDLRLVTPRLELRLPTDDELSDLADVAAGGIHEPGTMPFSVPWSEQPSPQLERGVMQWAWRQLGDWSVASWKLNLVAFLDGRVVGTQGVMADDFPVARTVTSGSWLGRAWQGQGLGKEMRAAVLHLAFAGLGARLATTEAWEDNPASIAVTTALGYEDDGWTVRARKGEACVMRRYRLTRERWEERRTIDVSLHDLEPCLDLFGLGPDLEPVPVVDAMR